MFEWYDLNARQLAALYWGATALFLLVVRNSGFRKSIRQLIRAVVKPTIVWTVLGLLLTTAALSAAALYLGSHTGLLSIPPIVTSIVWVSTSGLVFLAGAATRADGEELIRGMLAKTLSPAAIVSVLLSFSILPFWWEIGLLPVVVSFRLLASFASREEQYAPVGRLFGRAIGMWIVALVALTIYTLVTDTGAWITIVESLVYPVWLSIGAIPYLCLLGQYDKLRFKTGARCKDVSASDYGSKWPLTVDKARLCCRHNAVWVEVNRKKYGVNGMAPAVLSRWGYNVNDLDDIWRTDPESYGGRVSIGPLIDDGLSLENHG